MDANRCSIVPNLEVRCAEKRALSRGNVRQNSSLITVLGNVHLRCAASAETRSRSGQAQHGEPELPHPAPTQRKSLHNNLQPPRIELKISAVMAGCAQMRHQSDPPSHLCVWEDSISRRFGSPGR